MSIILKENEWAEEKITSNDLGRNSVETLRRVGRYYLDKGFSKAQTYNKLNEFYIQCNPKSSLSVRETKIDLAMKYAIKYPAVNIESIDITDTELKKIDALSGRQIQRLAFTLLCLSKYWLAINKGSDGWVQDKDNQIMLLANINTSIKRQGLLYWKLRESGMIQFSKVVDNTNIKVLFAEEGETVLRITDFRNLGYQYMMYKGEPYFECQNCGLVTRYSNDGKAGGQKYCKECAYKQYIQHTVNSVMRRRNRNISENV